MERDHRARLTLEESDVIEHFSVVRAIDFYGEEHTFLCRIVALEESLDQR